LLYCRKSSALRRRSNAVSLYNIVAVLILLLHGLL
jgi:hypothetical protein